MAACHLLGVLRLVLLLCMPLVGLARPYVIKQKELEKYARLEGVGFSFAASEIVSYECTLGRRSIASTACRQLVSDMECKIGSPQCSSDKKESFLLNITSPMSIELEKSLENCRITVSKPINMKIVQTMFSNKGTQPLIALCSESLSVYQIPALISSPCKLVLFPRKFIEISAPRYAAAHKFGVLLCPDPSRPSARRSLISSEKVADQSNFHKLEVPSHLLPNLSRASTGQKSASTTAYSLEPPDPPEPTGVHP